MKVVTFDLECIRAELAVEPDIFSPTIFYEYQLYAQVLYLMEVITMDGLNAAGATTGIASPDCADCFEEVPLEALIGSISHLGGEWWRVTSALFTIGGVSTHAARIRRVDTECNWQILEIVPVTGTFARPNFHYECNGSQYNTNPVGHCLLEWNPDNYPNAGGAAKVYDIRVQAC